MVPLSMIGWISWMSLNLMSKRDSCHSSSTERSVSVKVGTHLTLGMTIVLTSPAES